MECSSTDIQRGMGESSAKVAKVADKQKLFDLHTFLKTAVVASNLRAEVAPPGQLHVVTSFPGGFAPARAGIGI